MATITFRSDEAVDEALRELTRERADRSTVIREAILDAWKRQRDAQIYAEALAVANDPADRAEMKAVMEDMDDLRAR